MSVQPPIKEFFFNKLCKDKTATTQFIKKKTVDWAVVSDLHSTSKDLIGGFHCLFVLFLLNPPINLLGVRNGFRFHHPWSTTGHFFLLIIVDQWWWIRRSLRTRRPLSTPFFLSICCLFLLVKIRNSNCKEKEVGVDSVHVFERRERETRLWLESKENHQQLLLHCGFLCSPPIRRVLSLHLQSPDT